MTEHDSAEASVDNPVTATTLSKQATIEPPNGAPVTSSSSSNITREIPKPTKGKSPTKFGKANPIRDILLLLAFLGGLMLLTSENGERKKKTEEDHEDDQQPSFASIETMIKDLARKTSVVTLRNSHCSLFLHTGSIPNTGLGYFAGRNYTIGEIILEDYRTIPLPVSALESGSDYLYATPSALVLKHHPILYNIEGVLYSNNENDAASNLQIRASKAITEGDELFVEYDPVFHNNPMFNHIPTESHYHRVNEIVTDALRSVPDQTHRSGRVTCRMAPVMRFVTRVVARYDPMVATLLPESYKRAQHYRTLHPSVATLRNSSLLQLRYKGVCMDDIMVPLNSDDENAHDTAVSAHHYNDVAAVAQRTFSRGTVISTVPLYVMKTTIAASLLPSQTCGLEQDCPSGRQQSNCFVNHNLTFISFCPLGPAIDQPLVDEGNDTTNVHNNNVPLPNVEYRWSQHSGVTEHFQMSNEFKYSTSIMGWDVVALRDIDIGEKVRIRSITKYVPVVYRCLTSAIMPLIYCSLLTHS